MKKLKYLFIIITSLFIVACSNEVMEEPTKDSSKVESYSKGVIVNNPLLTGGYPIENYLTLASYLTVRTIMNNDEAKSYFSSQVYVQNEKGQYAILLNQLINSDDSENVFETAFIAEYEYYSFEITNSTGVRPNNIPPPPPDDDDGDDTLNEFPYLSASNFMSLLETMCLEYYFFNVSPSMQMPSNMISTGHPLNTNLYNKGVTFTATPYLEQDIVVSYDTIQNNNQLVIVVRPNISTFCNLPYPNIDYTLFLQ